MKRHAYLNKNQKLAVKKGNLLHTIIAKKNHFTNLVLQGPFNQFSIGPTNYKAVILDELSAHTLLPYALFLHLFYLLLQSIMQK